MGKFVKGQVVILPFPFSDLSDTKRRPAFVVASLTGDDLIVCQITTVQRADSYAVSLNATDFVTGSLPHPSIIRPNRLFTADGRLILRTAGMLTDAKISEVTEKIVAIVTA